MDLLFLAILFVIIILGIGLYFLFKRLDSADNQDTHYLPDDGLIYDPVSGRELTVEEAEGGIILSPEVLSRVKSDEEIETYYVNEAKERAYIERELIVSGAILIGRDGPDWLDELLRLRKFVSFSLYFMYEVVPGRHLGIADVGYRHAGVSGSEIQFIGFIRGGGISQDGVHPEILKDLEVEALSTGLLFRLPRVAARADLDKLLALVRQA